jgi:hypothetical protein
MTADLVRYVSAFGLDQHTEYLLGIARPSVEIVTESAPIDVGRSKLGGSPDVPPGFAWPHHGLGPYRFLAQVNLADVPRGPHGLAADGMLSFFYAHDDNGETFWGDPDYIRVYKFGDIHALAPELSPLAVRLGATSRIRFEAGTDLPPWPWDEPATTVWPIAKSYKEAYSELRLKLHPSQRYLLGYPLNTTLAYDPTPGPDWRSLLTVSSDEDLEWHWHDGDWLVTFIEEQRLRAGDFSQVSADAG